MAEISYRPPRPLNAYLVYRSFLLRTGRTPIAFAWKEESRRLVSACQKIANRIKTQHKLDFPNYVFRPQTGKNSSGRKVKTLSWSKNRLTHKDVAFLDFIYRSSKQEENENTTMAPNASSTSSSFSLSTPDAAVEQPGMHDDLPALAPQTSNSPLDLRHCARNRSPQSSFPSTSSEAMPTQAHSGSDAISTSRISTSSLSPYRYEREKFGPATGPSLQTRVVAQELCPLPSMADNHEVKPERVDHDTTRRYSLPQLYPASSSYLASLTGSMSQPSPSVGSTSRPTFLSSYFYDMWRH
ncbi:hypothetical protein C8Q75DRAFT_625884 [Abortiporus biennis]|nr:hypothetical protein C8Q75DRAFT_625884 [Abortiporus biennis]